MFNRHQTLAMSLLAALSVPAVFAQEPAVKALLEQGKYWQSRDNTERAAEAWQKLLKLNPVGLKLLAVLMQKSPHVLRREILEEALWGDDCPDSDSLRSHVHQLRQVIDKPFAKPLLHTVHGVGYRLAEGRDGV